MLSSLCLNTVVVWSFIQLSVFKQNNTLMLFMVGHFGHYSKYIRNPQIAIHQIQNFSSFVLSFALVTKKKILHKIKYPYRFRPVPTISNLSWPFPTFLTVSDRFRQFPTLSHLVPLGPTMSEWVQSGLISFNQVQMDTMEYNQTGFKRAQPDPTGSPAL